MAQDYGSLVLEVSRQGDHLVMGVFEQAELASTIRHYSQYPIALSQVNKLSQEIISILNKVNKKGNQAQDLALDLKKAGQLLWDHLLARAVKERLKNAVSRTLVLFLDEELIKLPWELLYDGKDFLCLKFNLGRLVRTRQQPLNTEYRSISSKLKMLVLVNPTNDLKSAYDEGIYIKREFDKKRNQVSIDFKSTYIDTLYVKRSLRDYDIVHFAGHCEYDTVNPDNTSWVLSDGRFTAADILAQGQSLSLPGLVFSNACHSAEIDSDLMDANYQEKTYSLASAFLFSGVRHYIGTIRKVKDPASLIFAREFYNRLFGGQSIGECVRYARLKLVKEYGMESLAWVNHLLYGDPDFILLRKKTAAQLHKRKISITFSKKSIRLFIAVISVLAVITAASLWLPSVNPSTYILFSKTQKLFHEGSNQEVVLLCNRIIKNEPMFLAAYPLLADTYQRLGERQNALKCYFSYALYSEKKQDKNNLASAYIGLGWLYQLGGEYGRAFDFYNRAITLSRQNKDKLNEAAGLRKLAVWHIDKQDYDKALELLMKASEINRERKHIYAHRYNLACDYFDIGLMFTDKDDFITAKEFYQKSQRLFEGLKLKNESSDYYFNLGEIALFEKEYQKALHFYGEGLKIDETQGNKPSLASDYNMFGELYLEMGNLDEAEGFFKKSVLISEKIDFPLELASGYHNLGLLYKQQGRKNKAREYLRQAQQIYYRLDPAAYEKIKQEFVELNIPY